jgi:hypothetical protein
VCFGHTQLRGWGGWLALACLVVRLRASAHVAHAVSSLFPLHEFGMCALGACGCGGGFGIAQSPFVRCWVCPNEVGWTNRERQHRHSTSASSRPAHRPTHALAVSFIADNLTRWLHAGRVQPWRRGTTPSSTRMEMSIEVRSFHFRASTHTLTHVNHQPLPPFLPLRLAHTPPDQRAAIRTLRTCCVR